jgi:hypothetical protein
VLPGGRLEALRALQQQSSCSSYPVEWKFETTQKCSMVSAYPCGRSGQNVISVCPVKQARYKQMHISAHLKQGWESGRGLKFGCKFQPEH